ncbi:MAG: acyl carrier protein [Clostridia bacterium]|nr:acyl carrier protein [Clostridia bacterium]
MKYFDKVRDGLVNQLGVDAASVTAESRLIEDLKADSLDIVELVMDLEQEFNIQIPEEDLVKLRTVGDIAAYLENK